jgi:hypothetical protein
LGEWKYYQIIVPLGHETIKISATRFVGDIVLYINRCSSTTTAACVSQLPNSTFYTDKSANPFAPEYRGNAVSVSLTRSDSQSVSYLLAIQSLSFYAAYQVTASLHHTIIALQAGVQVEDQVDTDETDFYSFLFDSTDDVLTINLRSMSGNPDLYVSTTLQYPGPKNYTWMSTSYGSDTIVIDPRDNHDFCIRECELF